MTRRGTLRIYLGAAPGVGKTYAMLDEGQRRLRRGTDVVVGFVETHGRQHTEAQIDGLSVIARRAVTYRGAQFEEMDVDAVLARRPQVALIDELAHTNVPGSGRNAKRWQDIEALLDEGIDVVSTLNVQHLESMTDLVQQITGMPQLETVPDSVVRAADQIELVDMTPQALRRRMAHGNVYSSDQVDAALGNYFRPGNLTALRELALLWLADSVEEGMQRYRREHGITETWETKERIVVGLTGGPEGEALVRRAARIAARSVGADLLAVHIARNDGLAGPGVTALTEQRQLVESVGGTYHSVVGDDVPRALLDFARRVDATQLVLGASRRSGFAVTFRAGTGETVTRHAGAIDVHLVSHELVPHGRTLPALTGGLTVRRRVAGLAVGGVLIAAVTIICSVWRDSITLPSAVLLYLLVVVITSVIGGFYPAATVAIVGTLLLNYYVVPPYHTLAIADAQNILALAIFLVVASLVSRVVDVAARRSVLAARAGAEAETLSAFAGTLLRGEQEVPALLDRVIETFAMDSASLLHRSGDQREWSVVAASGPQPPAQPSVGQASVEMHDDLWLVLSGHPMSADDQRLLAAFAAHIAAAHRQQELTEAARAVEPLAEAERQRTALLNAVSHDLRTPIAAAKAAVSSLRAPEVTWGEEDRQELLASAEDSLDRLTDLVTNLLDLSRLQAGALPVLPSVVGLDDVVARALDHAAPGHRVVVDVPADLPSVVADAGLLERVIANVVQNALRYAPESGAVRVAASAHGGHVELRVIDHGPGIPPDSIDAVFQPFQRFTDSSSSGEGTGLGLAIARGLTEAMGGSVSAEPTPGGGATLVITLTASDPHQEPPR